MFDRPVAFVSEPTAGWADGRDPADLLLGSGFGGVAIRSQMGSTRVQVAETVRLRDRLRARGVKVAQWVVLDVGDDFGPFSMADAGAVAAEVAPSFDGTIVNAEAVLADTLPFLAEYRAPGPLAVSTLARFPMGDAAAAWDRRQAVLSPQAYVFENGHTATDVLRWLRLAAGETLWVGWHYRATVNGKGRRGKLVSATRLRTIDGLVGVDVASRRLYRLAPGARRYVGRLEGLWASGRVTVTVRTTPVGDRYPSAAEIRADRASAGVPIFLYLAETTPLDFWLGYR